MFQGDEGEGEEDDEEQGEAINGPEFMPMAWDNLKLGESSLLAAILSGTGKELVACYLVVIYIVHCTCQSTESS